MTVPPELASLAAGAINLRVISDHRFELLRLALSIKTGTVTASRLNSFDLERLHIGYLDRAFG
jgi:Tn3 transposase DDE domain